MSGPTAARGTLWGPSAVELPSSGLVYPAYVPALKQTSGVEVVPEGYEKVEIFNGGALMRFRGPKRPGKLKKGLRRGKCRGMSRGARKRQLDFVQAIDREQVKGVIFVTMTMRGGEAVSVVESWDRIEAARRKWFKRVERHLAPRRWFAIWRKEPHLSGLAHLHVLLFFLDELPNVFGEFVPWNDSAWASCVGDDSIRRTACKTEYMRSWNGVVRYLAKYLSKEADQLQDVNTGKVWDVVHRQLVPLNMSELVLKREVLARARRVARKWQQRNREYWQAFLPSDDGGMCWRRIFPVKYGPRSASVADQLRQLKLQGVRVRRRRRRGAYTADLRVWTEDDVGMRPADLERDGLKDRPGVMMGMSRSSKFGFAVPCVVERHTFYGGTYYLPAAQSHRLLEWAAREHVDQLAVEASLPF